MIRHQSWQADFDLSYTPPSSAADETVETVSRSKRTIVWLTSLLFFFFFRDTDERDYKLHLFSSRPFGKTHLESLLAHLFKARTTYWGKMSKYYGTRKQMSLFLHGFLSGKKKKGKPASRERGTVAVPDDDAKRNTKPCIVVVS